jgi:hypothetical protein
VSPPLEARVEARLDEIGTAELLVGIPSYNNARTIGHVVARRPAASPSTFRTAAP